MPAKRKPLIGKAELFVRLEARGTPRAEIYQKVFEIDLTKETDPALIARCDNQMSRWRRHPDYRKVWDDEVHQYLRKTMGKALKVINKSMAREDLPWLQLNAANSALANATKQLMENDEKQITVKVEGMPELGKPGEGEQGDG